MGWLDGITDQVQKAQVQAMAKALAEARRNSLKFRIPENVANSDAYTAIDFSLKVWDVLTGLLDIAAAVHLAMGASAAATISAEAIAASEAAAQASAMVGLSSGVTEGLTFGVAMELGGPLVAWIGLWVGLGAPYLEAKQKIAEDHALRGVAHGVLVGAFGWRPSRARDFLLRQPQTANNNWIPGVTTVAQKSYQMAFIAGYKQGRDMSLNQRKVFWQIFYKTMHKASVSRWNSNWQEGDPAFDRWFWDAGGAFIKYHLKT